MTPKSALASFPNLCIPIPLYNQNVFFFLVFGLWFPSVAGSGDRPHCHQVLLHKSVTVVLNGTAFKRIMISLFETGQHPKNAFTMSLYTKIQPKLIKVFTAHVTEPQYVIVITFHCQSSIQDQISSDFQVSCLI